MAGLPPQIVENQRHKTKNERDQRQVLECQVPDKRLTFEFIEFTDHPVGVGAYPAGNGQVMA